ncbi:hypothetical protein GCM10027261_19330 [Geodermatophilus arenarius]|uniref:O-antigen ligase like membrane protein n=1 Tax=Geodermatophilus arenarius TaxID=1137990 RepID=A0ABV9LIU5_9ACTN
MTSLTVVTVAVVVYGVLNRRGYGRALALGGATPVGAAVVVGAVAVPTFYAVAIGALVGVGLRLLQGGGRDGRDRVPVPGSRALVLLVVVGVLVTLVAPLLFDGLEVEGPSGLDEYLVAGVVTKSNIAQIVYLVLSVGVVAYLARSRWTGPQIVGTATCLATLLSFGAYLHTTAGLPFPEGFFDNSPNFAFIQTLPGGAPRVRGIFSEPSGLAASCLVTLAYCCSRLHQVMGIRRVGLVATAGIALYLGAISTSTSFLVAGMALLAVAACVATLSFVLRRGAVSRVAVTWLCAAALAALWVLPTVANFVGQQLADKVTSSSYAERSNADSESYRVLLDTFGLGTGLGSNRGSSFISTLLSTVGVVGALLFASAVVVLVRRSWPARHSRPAAWALITLLLCKVVSGPDLSDSGGVLWLSLGVLAHAALRLETVRRPGVVATAGGATPRAGVSGPARQALPSS